MKRSDPPIPLLKWRPGEYIKAADHDADSRPFYERQMARIARMQQPAPSAEVKQLRRTK